MFASPPPDQEPAVRQALEDLSSPTPRRTFLLRRDQVAFAVYGALTLLALAIFYVWDAGLVDWSGAYEMALRKGLRLTGLVSGLLVLRQATLVLVRNQAPAGPTRFNLRRVVRLAFLLVIGLVAASVLFANWYATLLSLGVVSLITGIALQNPIASFFAWVYILLRRPYAVGDRIKIGAVMGDVVDVGYFDTTLWEFNGDYLSGDHPSGRIIRFANGRVFSEYITNYSWPVFPYIWTELKLFIAPDSDFDFVTETARRVVDAEIGPEMAERIRAYRELLRRTPIDELTVSKEASVSFRPHENGWMEVVIRYLVEPRQAGAVRNRLFHQLWTALRQAPERVRFPNVD